MSLVLRTREVKQFDECEKTVAGGKKIFVQRDMMNLKAPLMKLGQNSRINK